MAKFYGTLQGDRGQTTRIGNHGIRASLQSYDGSVISEMFYGQNGKLCIRIEYDNGSSENGNTAFVGTVDEFLEKLVP